MQQFFQKLTDFLESEVAPIANALDEDAALFSEVHRRFVELGSLNFLIPKNLGGLGGERQEWIEYNILMAQYSGALLFLQAQHQFSISQLKKLLPNPKVEEVLRTFVREGQGVGLTLAKDRSLLTVEAVAEGYRLSGKFLWATGFGYFSQLLVSFEYDETLFYALLPFQALQQDGGSIALSPKIETAVFNSVISNSVTLDYWLIPTSALLASHAVFPKRIAEHPTIYNLAGTAKALLGLAIKGRYGTSIEVQQRHALLRQRWENYYRHICEEIISPVDLRIEGLQLAEKCALLARVSCGSAGILRSHPLGRLIREVWQYTVAGYSEDQMRAYLSKE